MQAQAWEDMCRQWNTEAWLKRSGSGTSNRNTTDSGGNISRHTGGSIGYDEHRIRLQGNYMKRTLKPCLRSMGMICMIR
ncbi:hypothetical protein L2E82_50006 [Cichorium intybus]|nr:hypothetical protein L2E82_50006 [Cichorium intybus]